MSDPRDPRPLLARGVQDPATGTRGSRPSEPLAAAGDFQPDEMIEGTEYRVIRSLGEGGHASAYECENAIGKRVAVKVLHRHFAQRPDLIRKTLDEARRMARLRHSNIVEVFTAGMTGGDRPRPYIVMELLSGTNGRQLLCQKHHLEVANALDVLIDIAFALDVAHRAGVVHQDLKPDNIFIHVDERSPPPRKAVTKLLDFGVARMIGQEHEGTFEGTLAYAGPEQLTGNPVTPKTDLYALGVIAFELLTGRRPFQEEEDLDRDERDAQATAIHAGRVDSSQFTTHLVQAVLTKAPPRLCDFVRLPKVLEDLVLKLLEKEPARRPATAADVVNTLVAIRQNPALPPAQMTTQEILLSTASAQKVPVGKGSTLRMGTIDVAAAARAMGLVPAETDGAPTTPDAPLFPAEEARPDEGALSLAAAPPHMIARTPAPRRDAELALPPPALASIARTPTARRDDDPRTRVPINTNRLPSAPAIREKAASVPSVVDMGPPPAAAVVGTFEPVVDKRRATSSAASSTRAPVSPRASFPRRVVMTCVAAAACSVLAFGVVGAQRMLRGRAASQSAPSATPPSALPPAAASIETAQVPPSITPPPASVASEDAGAITVVTAPPAVPSTASLPSSGHAPVRGSPRPSRPAPAPSEADLLQDFPEPAPAPPKPVPAPKRTTPKPAPSGSAHDDLLDWLERDKPKKPGPGPGPGF